MGCACPWIVMAPTASHLPTVVIPIYCVILTENVNVADHQYLPNLSLTVGLASSDADRAKANSHETSELTTGVREASGNLCSRKQSDT